MSNETRTIRPYRVAAPLEHALDGACMQFGPDFCPANSTLHSELTPEDFLHRTIAIRWASDDVAMSRVKDDIRSGAVASSLQLDDLALVIVATSSYLKLAEMVYCQSLSTLETISVDAVLTGGRRRDVFSAPFSGFALEAHILLAKDIERRPLRPYRKGTWLARVRFAISSQLTTAVLSPSPLTAASRQRLGLPPRTMRYVDFGNHDVTEPYREQEQPTFYVDDNVLAQLNARPNSATSRAFQRQLAFDFVSAVIWKAIQARDIGTLSYADIRLSLLGSVVRLTAGAGASDAARNNLLGMLAEFPQQVIARAEHAIDVLRVYGDAAKDGES